MSLDDKDDLHPVKELYGRVLSGDESRKIIDQINSIEFTSWNSAIQMGEMFKYFDNTNPSVY